VEVPYSILIQQQQLEAAGKLSRGEAQRRALATIAIMRLRRPHYFWVNDMHPNDGVHPMKPELRMT